MKNDQNISVYEQSVHVYGRIWTGMALILMILTPVAICCYYNAWPPLTAVLKSLLGVAPMYWTVGIIEVFTFVPMLGTGGSYLGFVTGNLTNLKDTWMIDFITGAKDVDADWDAYIAEMNASGLEEMVQEARDWYNANNQGEAAAE